MEVWMLSAALADTAAASSGVFCTIWEGGKRGWQVLKCVERTRAPSALNHVVHLYSGHRHSPRL